jgi:hypothetical protein
VDVGSHVCPAECTMTHIFTRWAECEPQRQLETRRSTTLIIYARRVPQHPFGWQVGLVRPLGVGHASQNLSSAGIRTTLGYGVSCLSVLAFDPTPGKYQGASQYTSQHLIDQCPRTTEEAVAPRPRRCLFTVLAHALYIVCGKRV